MRQLRKKPNYQDQPVVMVTTAEQRETRLAALEAGATDFLRKPVEPVELRARVHNLLALRNAQLALRDQKSWLEREVRRATSDLEASERDVVHRLSRAIDFRDGNTGDHVTRMATICGLIAEEMGLGPSVARLIATAAPLHDVGKIGVPDAILQKPGRLDTAELGLMQTHVKIGESILSESNSPLLRCAARIASSHHERWDGKGYPRGLAGDEIPMEGRIAAVADVFEALASDRIYRPAWSLERARAFIVAGSGSHFDPSCVAAFETCFASIAALMAVQPSVDAVSQAA
ncbi:MAG: HD domain-containing phosphohydrolase [Bosea sp. (in: a-proteobacteria)]